MRDASGLVGAWAASRPGSMMIPNAVAATATGLIKVDRFTSKISIVGTAKRSRRLSSRMTFLGLCRKDSRSRLWLGFRP